MTKTTNHKIENADAGAQESSGASSFARRMRRLGSWRIWIVSAALFVGFAGVFFTSSAPFAIPQVEAACDAAPLDVRPFSTADEVSSFLDRCGPDGREAYRNMQIADLFYPLVFGLFLASSLALALTRLFPHRPSVVGLAVVPLVAGAFDYLENVFAWLAIAAYPADAPTNGLLGLASLAKTTTSWVAVTLLLLTLGGLLVRLVRHRVPAQFGGLLAARAADAGPSS